MSGAAVLTVAGAAGVVSWLRERPPVPVASEVPTGTVTIVKTDLATVTTLPGTLGYTGTYEVYGGVEATVTWLPQPGQVINRGEPVYAVDNRSIRLFFADRPGWRDLSSGVTAGPDVQAVETNLVALGHATSANLTVDGTFTGATAVALRRWQQATGQAVTGRLDRGAVTFQPGPLRVTTIGAKIGAPAGGALLSGTSTAAGVTLAVPVDRMHLVHPNDPVRVTLPDGKKVTGKVTSLSTVASVPTGNDFGRPGLPTVPATVALDNAITAGVLDQAPVQVDVTGESATGVLAVPVTAIVALAGGGWGLYLVEDGTRRLVGVTPGLFTDTLVEVSGPDLHEGTTVEVPAI
jgi:peptidoglycan hydrolase-like protein with peptidoglycan-binding domain